MQEPKQRIGIMGGTFDPIHLGHLILGEKAYEQFQLDQVWFLPSGNPPHKTHREGRASDEQRVEMVRRAIAGNSHFALSLMEMHEDGFTYTYRTLELLKRMHPYKEFYFIIGADSLFQFETWKEPGRICQTAALVVATRNHTEREEMEQEMQRLGKKYNGTFLRLDTRNIDVSSEMLRKMIRDQKSIRYYVPDSVKHYIEQNHIYCEVQGEDNGQV